MDMATALAELGVTEASRDAKRELDRHGYTALAGILPGELLAVMRARLTGLLEAEGDRAGTELRQERGTHRLADLVNKDSLFHTCFTDPRVLACVAHVLGDFKLSGLNFRAALPGHGHQRLHSDWGPPVRPGVYQTCNAIWLLDDFTAENGSTRVVAGSHRSATSPRRAMADPAAAHPDEVRLIARAGTVIIVNSHVWHGGTTNHSDRQRRALISCFTRRAHPQQVDQKKYVRPQTLAALSPAARFILDV